MRRLRGNRKSDNGEPSAADAAAIGDHGPAAGGAHALAKPALADSDNLRWIIAGFHLATI